MNYAMDLEWTVLSGLAILAGAHIIFTYCIRYWRGRQAWRNRSQMQAPAPEKWPSVSIIIPAWQECGTIERCISSLRTVDYPLWDVIIAAGGPDGTYQAARNACQELKNFHVIPQLPGGKNAALNAGLKSAQGEILVLLDADTQISAGWLRSLVAPLTSKYHASTGNSFPLRRTAISLAEQMELIDAYEVRKCVILQGNASIALQRSLIDTLGGFPEDVKAGVDWDLSARLAGQGVTHAYCPDAVVHTERPATLAEYWHNEMRWRRAHLQSLFRLPGYFLANPRAVFSSLYIYALAWFVAVFTMVALAALLLGLTAIFIAWAIFMGWVLLSRSGIAFEIAAFTGEPQWLKIAWVPPFLLLVTFLAILPASLTWKKQTTHFKGPRSPH